jgi:NDP-sugar pyrophosphorylase family protein
LKGQRLRAIILAAGRGVRLRPLTEDLPKPLLPVTGKPIVHHTLEILAAAGIEAVALNTHHLGEQIQQGLGESFQGLPLTYSPEAELLGTLGAMDPLREFMAPADLVIVINGDSLCRWPLKKLVKRHLQSDAVATLLFSKKANRAQFGGGVEISRSGRVESFHADDEKKPGIERLVFAGAHVFSPRLLDSVGEGVGDFVRDLYGPLIEVGGHIGALVTGRHWQDLGSPERYLEACLRQSRSTWAQRVLGRSWSAGGAKIDSGARVKRSVVEAGARIEPSAEIEDSVVLPRAVIGQGSVVKRSIVGFDVPLPPSTIVVSRLVTRAKTGVAPEADASTLGELIYSPLNRL